MTDQKPNQLPDNIGITPSQTVGPFFAYCLTPSAYGRPLLASNILYRGDSVSIIRIEGRITDGEGNPAPDVMIEVWQADEQGRHVGYDRAPTNDDFIGFGRIECDSDGKFAIETIKPGPVRDLEGNLQAPHLNLAIFGKGLQKQLFTRIYFSDEAMNEADLVLALVPEGRRYTLIADKDEVRPGCYHFDIRMQGENETAFFAA